MTNINYEYIEDYIKNLIPEKDQFMKDMRCYADEYHIPIVDIVTESFIKFLIKIKNPKKVLELGTAIGYSAISFVRDSTIEEYKTVEIKDEMVNIARDNICKSKLDNKITVYLDDAFEFLKKLEDEEKFDIIFIDAAKGQYEKYFDIAIDHLSHGGIIICDNVLFKGMIANNDLVKRRKITIVKRLRKFLKRIEEDENYNSSIVPIGDGVILIGRKYE